MPVSTELLWISGYEKHNRGLEREIVQKNTKMSNLEKVYLTIREGETTSNLIMFKKSGVKSVRSEFKNWDVVLIQLSIIYRDRISD